MDSSKKRVDLSQFKKFNWVKLKNAMLNTMLYDNDVILHALFGVIHFLIQAIRDFIQMFLPSPILNISSWSL